MAVGAGPRGRLPRSSSIPNATAWSQLEAIDTGRYGRSMGHICLGARHFNREMVREGHAWVYRKYLRDRSLLDDEAAAREAEARLWSLPEAQRTPPWEWRAARRGGLPELDRAPEVGDFRCGAKRYCREMTFCEEARFYLDVCRLTRLDGDGDGVPCEEICRSCDG